MQSLLETKVPYSLKIICTSEFLICTKIVHTCCIIHQTGSLVQSFIIGEMFSDILPHWAGVLLTLVMDETRFRQFIHTLSIFTSSYTELQRTCCVCNGTFSANFANGERFVPIVAVQNRPSHELQFLTVS